MSAAVAELEAHRQAITGHCYRMLGSAFDADDAAQETMMRAWRGLDRFDGRASLRTWLHRIATRVCLDELKKRGRRARPMEEGPAFSGPLTVEALVQLPRTHWIEPVPDASVIPGDCDPAQRAMLRQSVRLAFIAALQKLPPRQRAVLLLIEVLDCSATEAAESLNMTVAAVNSALQRARASVKLEGQAADLTAEQHQLLKNYVDAFERYDVDRFTSLLREDASFSMPPYALWLQGRAAVRKWMLGPGCGCRGSKLIPTAACGSPAFGQYRPAPGGGHTPWALVVIELEGNRIAAYNSFLDAEALFPRFGLPFAPPA